MDGKWVEGKMDERVRWMSNRHIRIRPMFVVNYMKECECCKHCIVHNRRQTQLVALPGLTLQTMGCTT